MTSAPAPQPDRGIGSIAHLFLSQQSQAAARRRPPQERADAVPLSFSEPSGAADPDIPLSPDERSALLDESPASPARPIVFTTCADEDIVEAYKTIKQLHAAPPSPQEISLLVCDADDLELAQAVYDKIATVCRRFLQRDIPCAGCWTVDDPNNIPFDQLLSRHNARHFPADPQASSSAQDSPAYPVHVPILLDALPATDDACCRILTDHLDQWLTLPGASVLEFDAGLALPAATTALVDDGGRLYACVAALAADAPIWTIALTARAELHTHRHRLTLELPQHAIDPHAPIGLVLLSPHHSRLAALVEQFDFPVLTHRLCLLDHPAGPALLIL